MTKAGLVAPLVAHETSELAQAVESGELTQAQPDRLSAHAEDHVSHMVDGDFPRRSEGPRRAPSSDA